MKKIVVETTTFTQLQQTFFYQFGFRFFAKMKILRKILQKEVNINSAWLPDSIDFSFLLWSPGSLAFSLSPLSLAQLPNLSVRCLCFRRGEDKQEQHEEDEAEDGGQDAYPYVLNRYEPLLYILSEVNRDFFLTHSMLYLVLQCLKIILQNCILVCWLNPGKIASA